MEPASPPGLLLASTRGAAWNDEGGHGVEGDPHRTDERTVHRHVDLLSRCHGFTRRRITVANPPTYPAHRADPTGSSPLPIFEGSDAVMLLRFDPFRDIDRLAHEILGAPWVPQPMPMDLLPPR